MTRTAYWPAALAAFLFVYMATAGAQPPRQVRVLVLVPDDDEAMTVRVMTKGDFVTGAVLTGLLPALIDDAVIRKRSAPHQATLARTMAGFERNPALVDALSRSFTQRAGGKDVFAVTATGDFARYVKSKGIDNLTPAARSEGYDYVALLYTQYVGFKTRHVADADAGLIAPIYSVTFAVRRVADDKAILRTTAQAFGYWGKPIGEAVTDRAAFETIWPELCKIVAGNFTGELNRTDNLHAMAASVGRGDEVPAVGKLLEEQARYFKWDLKPVDGWREAKVGTPYARVLEPKDASRQIIGLRFDLDLLVPEFGQDVRTLEEYVEVHARRRLELVPEFLPLEKFSDISAAGFDAYSSDTATGVRNILLFKRLDERRVQVVTAVFLRDFATLYPANRARIEKMLADSVIRLR